MKAGNEMKTDGGMNENRRTGKNNGMDLQYGTLLRAGEIMREYRKRKWISNVIVLLDIIFLVYLAIIKMDYAISYMVGGFAFFLMILSVFALYGVIAAIAIFIKWLGAVKIDKTLCEECDPFVYEACIDRLHTVFYKERVAVLRAMAKYYQGDSRSAEEIFRNVNLYKLKGLYKVNYYILMSAIYFERGEGMRAAELEQSYRAGIRNKKEQILFKTLCASNNLIRAMENKDYQSAFRFLAERKELDSGKCRKWTHIAYSMFEAEVYAEIGDEKSARLNLNYVIAEGGRLLYVEKAKELLKKMDTETKEGSADAEPADEKMVKEKLADGEPAND